MTPPRVDLPWADAQRLFARDRELSEIEAKQAVALQAKESERLTALAKQEGAEIALKAQKDASDAEIATLQKSYHGSLKLNEIATATASVGFVSPEAAAQARAIMADRLEVRKVGDILTVVEKNTLRPAAEAVKAWLDTAEFKHFQAALHRGGSGAGNSHLSPPPNAIPPEQRSYSELAIEQAKQARINHGNPYNPTRLFATSTRN